MLLFSLAITKISYTGLEKILKLSFLQTYFAVYFEADDLPPSYQDDEVAAVNLNRRFEADSFVLQPPQKRGRRNGVKYHRCFHNPVSCFKREIVVIE